MIMQRVEKVVMSDLSLLVLGFIEIQGDVHLPRRQPVNTCKLI